MLALYQKTPKGWAIDTDVLDAYLRVISQVDRPVVVYLAADHFDSLGPLPTELAKDPRNLMHLAGGKPLELGYFGYRIIPYTLLADPAIPVNRYRFEALRHVAQKVAKLPAAVQKRIIAVTLAGWGLDLVHYNGILSAPPSLAPTWMAMRPATSLIGASAISRRLPLDRCVSGSKVRMLSSCRPKKSKRSGVSMLAGNRSTRPPRTAYSPCSRTVGTRR